MKIDKNVPSPMSSGKTGAPRKYPFAEMEVGDSVFIEGAATGGREYVAAQVMGRNKGWKFSGRKDGSGLRIWRIA